MITVNQSERDVTKMHDPKRKSFEYRAVYFFVFSSSLLVVSLSFLVKMLVHPIASFAQERESVFAEARGAANSSVPYIYKR